MDGGSLAADLIIAGTISIITGPLLGMIIGFIAKIREKQKLALAQIEAYNAITELRSAYYCSRDDLVFKGKKSGSPEEFISRLLS